MVEWELCSEPCLNNKQTPTPYNWNIRGENECIQNRAKIRELLGPSYKLQTWAGCVISSGLIAPSVAVASCCFL